MDRASAPNPQYSVARPDSFAVRLAARVRAAMFARFMAEFSPAEADLALDIGVTSDQSYEASNYFEELYPFKHRVTAAGIDDASFLERAYPGMKFVRANALELPFEDKSFDFVHSSAVIEHVGSLGNQARMVAQCVRVARKGVFLTTPNRWFPIEFHTHLPLVHWLPKPSSRAVMRALGYGFFAAEENLNLMSAAQLARIARPHADWRFHVAAERVLGWKSNLILVGHHEPSQGRVS